MSERKNDVRKIVKIIVFILAFSVSGLGCIGVLFFAGGLLISITGSGLSIVGTGLETISAITAEVINIPKLIGKSAKARASEVTPAASTWSKLQVAYSVETGQVGNCFQIGYTPPKSETFAYDCGLDEDGVAYWVAENYEDLDECKAGNQWVLFMTSDEYDPIVQLPQNKSCQKLTPSFSKLGKSKAEAEEQSRKKQLEEQQRQQKEEEAQLAKQLEQEKIEAAKEAARIKAMEDSLANIVYEHTPKAIEEDDFEPPPPPKSEKKTPEVAAVAKAPEAKRTSKFETVEEEPEEQPKEEPKKEAVAKTKTYKTGFNCNTAKTVAGKTICSDEELAKLDLEMVKLYKPLADYFEEDQKEWMKKRNRCEDDVACLKKEYKARIKFFKDNS